MKKAICLMLILMLCALPVCADELRLPHTDSVRVEKFGLRLVNGQFWIVQRGDWNWEEKPVTLNVEYEGGSESIALSEIGPGRAVVHSSAEEVAHYAAEHGDEALKCTLSYEEDGRRVILATDYPLLARSYNAIYLTRRLRYDEGALWYVSDAAGEAPGLLKTFSDGTVERLPLPDTDGQKAVMLLTPTQIEADLSGEDAAWVVYALEY